MLKSSLTLALLLAAVPALAQGQASVRVSHADLNLATAAGVARLDHRINRAVDKVCKVANPADLRGQLASNACFRATRTAAAAQRNAAIAAARRAETYLASVGR